MDKGEELYYSNSKGRKIPVSEMSDTYVRRAFCRMLREGVQDTKQTYIWLLNSTAFDLRTMAKNLTEAADHLEGGL